MICYAFTSTRTMFKPLAITDKQRLHLLIFCRQLLVAATIVQQHRHRALRSQCSQNHWLPFAWCNTQKMKSTFQLWGHVRDTLSASIARHCQEVRLAFRLVCKDRWGWGHLGLLYVKYQSIISRKWYTCRSSSLILVIYARCSFLALLPCIQDDIFHELSLRRIEQ